MALKATEQPTRLRGTVVESAINTFTAKEISIPRILENKELFDADQINITMDSPVRTTVGNCRARAQLIISDDEPSGFINEADPKLVAQMELRTLFALLESAAGVFTVQEIFHGLPDPQKDGHVDSTRWRNFLPDDKVWMCVHSVGVTSVIGAEVTILGKLDKASQDDFNALVISRL